MTRDDIIRLAREQGYDFNPAMKPEDAIEIAYQLGAAAEREACAKVCESEWSNVAEKMYGKECAAVIRARGRA